MLFRSCRTAHFWDESELLAEDEAGDSDADRREERADAVCARHGLLPQGGVDAGVEIVRGGDPRIHPVAEDQRRRPGDPEPLRLFRVGLHAGAHRRIGDALVPGRQIDARRLGDLAQPLGAEGSLVFAVLIREDPRVEGPEAILLRGALRANRRNERLLSDRKSTRLNSSHT